MLKKFLFMFFTLLPLNVFAAVDSAVVARAEKYLNAL